MNQTEQQLAAEMAEKTNQQLCDMVAAWPSKALAAAIAELQKRNLAAPPRTPPKNPHHYLVAGVAVIGIGVAALSFFLPGHKHLVVAIWTIGVPFWSWLEYTFLVREHVKNDKSAFERLKYSQELGSKVWLAIAAILALFYLDWPGKPQ